MLLTEERRAQLREYLQQALGEGFQVRQMDDGPGFNCGVCTVRADREGRQSRVCDVAYRVLESPAGVAAAAAHARYVVQGPG
jgi:hypothetical protein